MAKPLVPSEASISTQKEPRTLMPQLVRDERYFSHPDMGVEMGLSTSQCPPLTYPDQRSWSRAASAVEY